MRVLSLCFWEIGAVLFLSLMPVALLGRGGRHAFTSLAFLGLACAADFPGHLFLRSSLLGYFLIFGFPRYHVDSSVDGLSVSIPSSVNDFVRAGQQKQSQDQHPARTTLGICLFGMDEDYRHPVSQT
jgi:hypothetical protein